MSAVDLSSDEVPEVRSTGWDPDFRRYWWARTCSSAGSVVTLVALPVLAYRMSGSPLITAATSALEAVPYLLFGLLAGALADRWDRQRVMVVADTINAAVVLSVPVAYALGVLTIPHVLVVALLGPAVAVFFDGANFGALPLLVGRGRIGHANALLAGMQNTVETVLPALVGVCLAVIAPAPMLFVDAASFVASAVLVAGIGRALHDRTRTREPLSLRGLVRDIAAGLRYLVRHGEVRTMTLVGTLQCIAGGGFMALMVVWCDRVLHVGTSGVRFAVVYSTWGIGGVAAALTLPRVLRRVSPATVTLRALPLSAILGIVTSMATNWLVAAVAMLVWGLAYTAVTVNSVSYRQQVTPEHMLSRVNTAGRMLSWGVGWTGGAVVGGALGTLIGVRPAIVVMAAVSFIAVALAWTSPLRRAAVPEPL